MKRLDITGLRGIAACIIAYIFHYTILFQAMPHINSFQSIIMGELARYGAYMSEIFFLLSGMLMYAKYSGSLYSAKFSEFFIPKVRKIYPLMICTALMTWILQYIGHWKFGYYILHPDGAETRNSLTALILSVIGAQTGWISDNDTYAVNGPSWFISVWLVCKIFFFLITKYGKRECLRNLGYAFFTGLGLVLMLCPVKLPLLYWCSGRGYFSFFAGVLLVQIFEKLGETGRRLGCIFSFLILVCALYFAYSRDIPNFVIYTSVVIWPSLVFLSWGSCIIRKILGASFFVWLGEMCMPIFLCNMFTDVLIRYIDLRLYLHLDYADIRVWGGHVLFSLVIAWIFHCIFEKRKKIIPDRRQRDEKGKTIKS